MTDSVTNLDAVDVSVLREKLRDVLDAVMENGKRLKIVRHGKPVAAVVPLGDLERLEQGDRVASAMLHSEAASVAASIDELSVDDALEWLQSQPRGEDEAATIFAQRANILGKGQEVYVAGRQGATGPSATTKAYARLNLLIRLQQQLVQLNKNDNRADFQALLSAVKILLEAGIFELSAVESDWRFVEGGATIEESSLFTER